jgi:hypothetical protein
VLGLRKEYSCAHGAQINIGDLTPYITYDADRYEEYTGCHSKTYGDCRLIHVIAYYCTVLDT